MKKKDILLNSAKEHKDSYKKNKPFPHIYLKDIFSEDFLDDVVENIWKEKDDYPWFRFCTDGNDFSIFGDSVVELTNYLISDKWVNFLRELTGIKTLKSDKQWNGGGINFEPRGSHLEPHTDFNTHSRASATWRRVNLLLFLSSKEWKKSWGGYNEIGHTEKLKGKKKSIYVCDHRYSPKFNTAVIFNTSPFSFHAFDLVKCPENKARIVISSYYYSDEPGSHKNAIRGTNYVGWDKKRQKMEEYRDRYGTGWEEIE